MTQRIYRGESAPGNRVGLHYSRFPPFSNNTLHRYQILIKGCEAEIGASERRIREDGLGREANPSFRDVFQLADARAAKDQGDEGARPQPSPKWCRRRSSVNQCMVRSKMAPGRRRRKSTGRLTRDVAAAARGSER